MDLSETVEVLDKEKHKRLIQDLDEVARVANIPVYLLKRSAKEFCTEEEIAWLINVRKHADEGVAGLCLVGEQALSVDTKLMAMGAAMIRNYIDARVIPITDLIAAGTDMSEVPNPTVMLVPNFYISSGGKPLAGWQIQALHSILLNRYAMGKQTILYVQNMTELGQMYGQGVQQFIQAHYNIIY